MKARYYPLVGVVLAASYVAGACGDDDDDSGPTGGAAGAAGGGGGAAGAAGLGGGAGQGGQAGAAGQGGGGGQAGAGGGAPLEVLKLTAGNAHTCALLNDGTLRCWGENGSGQLGYGNTANIGDDETPAKVGPVKLGAKALQISAGANHTCALLEGGGVRCWGENGSSQLGNLSKTDVGDDETPDSVGLVQLGAKALEVAAGGNHSCALLEGGLVRCWGSGSSGVLGYGDAKSIGDDEAPSAAGPVDLGGGKATKIAAGQSSTCAVLGGGLVRCWGLGTNGLLGYGTTDNIGDNETPASVDPVALGAKALEVDPASGHICAVLEGGLVRCWGDGGTGALGYGNTANIGDNETPQAAGPVDLGLTATKVATGSAHSCALLEAGFVRCWGRSEVGELGYGTVGVIGDDERPVTAGPVDLGGKATQISVGGQHTCVLLEGGGVRCWGRGDSGQLGYGNTDSIGDNETPASVGTVPVF